MHGASLAYELAPLAVARSWSLRGEGWHTMAQTLGEFVRECRETLGLTQEELAERIDQGVRQSEVSRLENDRISLPRRARLEQLAVALEVSLGDLMVRTRWMSDEGEGGRQAPPAGAAPTRAGDDEVTTRLDAVEVAIADARAAVAAADDRLRSAAEALERIRNLRGIIRPPIGVIEDWESVQIIVV